MANAKELREKMANIATEARAKLDTITDKTPEDRAAEIEREFDAMMSDHDKMRDQAERLERSDAAIKDLDNLDLSKTPDFESRAASAVDQGAQIDYRRAFAEMIAEGGDGHVNAEVRQALQEHRVQTGGSSAGGGYTVPTTLANFIVESMKAFGPMYDDSRFTVINDTSGNTLQIPTIDDTAVTAVAHTEGGAVTDDGGKDATFGQKSLSAYSFDTEWVRWSHELNTDSVLGMESFLGRLLGARLGRKANAELTSGTGDSAVEGIVTGSTLGHTAASNTAIASDEIIDLVHSVDPAYRVGNAAFMMNDQTLKAIRKLKDGDGNYLWQMGNIQAGIPQSLLGYDVVINQDMDNIATGKKTIIFGDMAQYYVRKVGAPALFVARERFAPDYGILGYIRFDGLLVDTAAVKHLIQP